MVNGGDCRGSAVLASSQDERLPSVMGNRPITHYLLPITGGRDGDTMFLKE